MHSNELNGSIPAAISHLTDLSSIRLAHNKLSGSIPAAASALKKLRELTVEGNHDLSGPIPSVLTLLTTSTRLKSDTPICQNRTRNSWPVLHK